MLEVTMRERKKEATKVVIMEAAVQLIKEKGYGETTMQSIAEKADVSLRTMYNYFPSKESIVATYMREVVESKAEEHWDFMLNLDSTYDRLSFICDKVAEWSVENPVLTEIYASDPRNYYYAVNESVPRSGIDEVVGRVLMMGRELGDVNCQAGNEVLVRQFMGFFYLSILTWLGNPSQDLIDIFREGLEFLYKGIRPEGAASGELIWGLFC